MEQYETLKHMHDVAGKYHTHFSTVRAATSGLLVPIGILSSITLLINVEIVGIAFPLFFIAFIMFATLTLNLYFSSWSRACLRIERYYETILLNKNISFDSEAIGFRHLFYYITKGSQEAGGERKVNNLNDGAALEKTISYLKCNNTGYLPKPIHPLWSFDSWRDPFVVFTIIAGSIYFAAYGILLIHYGKEGF